MHRHLLVFIPPVITVPWHGDSTGGEGHSTEHGTTTARWAEDGEIVPHRFVLLLEGTKTGSYARRGTPLLQGRAAAGSAQHQGGLLFLSGVNSGFSTPLPTGVRGIIWQVLPGWLLQRGPQGHRGWCSLQGWDVVSRVMGTGRREGGVPHPASSLRGKSEPPGRL